MCDVSSAMMAFSVAKTGWDVYNQLQQADYQADVAKENAKTARAMAHDAQVRADQQEAAHRLKVGQFKASQRTKMAAGNSATDVGSNSDILADTAMMGELDALTIRDNGVREAFGYQRQASQFENQADLYKSAGVSNAIGSLFSGGAQVADYWYNANKGTTTTDPTVMAGTGTDGQMVTSSIPGWSKQTKNWGY